MESPNNRGWRDKVLPRHLLLPNEASIASTDTHLLDKGRHGDLQIIQTMTTDCSSQTEGKALLLKAVPTHLIEHREVEMVLNLSLHLY